MKLPKNFDRYSLADQENWLVKQRQELQSKMDVNSRNLARVRGGQKLEVSTEIRADEAIMKQ